jgi:hypothetical protein
VSKPKKSLARVLRGTSDKNIGFADLVALLIRLGFEERVRGGHHIFTRDGVEEILNLQPKSGKAKPYQVKQVREVIVGYGLADVLDGTDEPDAGEDPAADEEGSDAV